MSVIEATAQQDEHSWFAPSKTRANILCPGKVNAEKGLEDESNPDADMGVDCHSYMYLHYTGGNPLEAEAKFVEGSYQKVAVADAIKQVDLILEQLKLMNGEPQIEYEVKAILSEDATIFGTIDVRMWFPLTGHLVVLDYKFGRGAVDALSNYQMLPYSYMSLGTFPAVSVENIIIQPRLGDPKRVTYSAEDVKAWAKNVYLPGIEASKDPNAVRIPGEEQCRYCLRGRKGCEERIQATISAYDPLNAPVYDTEAIKEEAETIPLDTLYSFAVLMPFLKDTIKEVDKIITKRLLAGEEHDELKLVHKATHRKWKDEEQASSFLARKKLKESERYTKKLVSPSEAEKLIDIDNAPPQTVSAFRKLIEYPVGDPTWAFMSDTRSEYKPEELTDDIQETVDSFNAINTAIQDVSSLF